MKVLVTGATGYIGRHLMPLLPDARAFARDANRARAILGEKTDIALGDMADEAALKTAVIGCGAVIHLAARKSDEADILDINVEGAKRLIDACKGAGIKRVINVGSQAARMERRGLYGESKKRADELFAKSGLEYTNILPSVVYGPKDPGVFGKLARVAASAPVVPVIGDGKAKYRPVHVEDLCRAIAGCLNARATIGKTYSVGGPETITLEGLIDLTAARAGRSPLKVHLPGAIAMLIANVGSALFTSPPLSRSNVLGAIQSVPEADWNALFAELSVTPRDIKTGLAGGI